MATETNLERIYQDAIAALPRSEEKDGGFREADLVKEITKRMTTGTDREKWLAATAQIEHKTQEGSTPIEGYIEGMPFEPERLVRWGEWLIEFKNMTLPWFEEFGRQADEQYRQAKADYDRHKLEHAEAMELFSGLLDRENLTITKAAHIKYRQGDDLARKWLLDLESGSNRLHLAMMSAAVAAHPNWQETKSGTYEMIDKSQPDDFDGIVEWFQVTHPLKAREVHKAVVAELKATEQAIQGAITVQAIVLEVQHETWPDAKPDPEFMTDCALKEAAKEGHVIDRERMYFLLHETIGDWGPDDWKLPGDGGGGDDDPDTPAPGPTPVGGELVA